MTTATLANTGRYRPERLPLPVVFYERELGHLSCRSRRWVRTACPLHRGHNRTAFAVNLETGGFYCHSCGAKGGDIVAFVQQRDGVDFKTAASSLGAWDDSARMADITREMAARQQQRERIERAADALAAAEHALWRDCRDRIHDCDRVLSTPGPWSEAQWQRAWAACTLRDDHLLPIYTLLSWGPMADRTRYVLADEQARAEMAAAVRMAGGVRTDVGHWREVLL